MYIGHLWWCPVLFCRSTKLTILGNRDIWRWLRCLQQHKVVLALQWRRHKQLCQWMVLLVWEPHRVYSLHQLRIRGDRKPLTGSIQARFVMNKLSIESKTTEFELAEIGHFSYFFSLGENLLQNDWLSGCQAMMKKNWFAIVFQQWCVVWKKLTVNLWPNWGK